LKCEYCTGGILPDEDQINSASHLAIIIIMT